MHRVRLFAQHLPTFNWQPIVLTVHEKFYEEKPDYNLVKLLPQNLRIEKVNAFGVTAPRLVGDIGIRAFFQLYKKAKNIIANEKIDFLLISIPSFYCALLGCWLHSSTGIKYGIDYQDPWVHHFPGSEKILSRHWFSSKIAKFLEPIAIKKASVISGISESYFNSVIERNPHLKNIKHAAIPMGGELQDYKIIKELNISPYLFTKRAEKTQFVYAGAFLPKAVMLLHKVLEAIKNNIENFSNVEFHFIGTGKKENEFSIKPIAQKYDLWNTIVFEYPNRIPYLDVLLHLDMASAVFILGSTEAHYTPSKVYQAVLSNKPIFAILHQQSTAVEIIRNSGAGKVLSFTGEDDIETIKNNFLETYNSFLAFYNNYNSTHIDTSIFTALSAKEVTRKLANLINEVV